MKIRSGFVSNSSSSSFLIYGVKLQKPYDYEALENRFGYDSVHFSESDGCAYVGYVARCDETDYKLREITPQCLNATKEKLIEAGYDPKDIGVFFGMEYC